MKPEIWLPIDNFEDSYMVSNIGFVRSLDRYVEYICRGKLTTRLHKGKIRKLKLGDDGYYCLDLYDKNCVEHWYRVNRLVAQAFIPNPENKPFVNHIDGVKTNNHVDNLEWSTELENTKHAIEIGLIKYVGSDNPNSSYTDVDVMYIRDLYSMGWTQKQIADWYKTDPPHIRHIVKRLQWKHTV